MNTQQGVFQIDIQQIFRFIYDLFTSGYGVNGFFGFFRAVWDFLNFISLFLAPLLFFGVVYVVVRLHQVHKEEHHRFLQAVQEAGSEHKGNEKWQKIISFVNSDNPAEWRHAIIEADVMLDELLMREGFIGDSLGERLKSVPQERMQSLSSAWEAHKVRNEIAHAGSDFILTKREARGAIDNYRKVFEEFHML